MLLFHAAQTLPRLFRLFGLHTRLPRRPGSAGHRKPRCHLPCMGLRQVPPSRFRRFDPQCRLRAFRTLAASRQSHPGQTQQSPFRMGKGARTVQHRQGGIRRSPENSEMHPDSRPALDGRLGTVRQHPPAPPAGIALRQTRSKPLHGFYSKRRKFRDAKRKHCRFVRRLRLPDAVPVPLLERHRIFLPQP